MSRWTSTLQTGTGHRHATPTRCRIASSSALVRVSFHRNRLSSYSTAEAMRAVALCYWCGLVWVTPECSGRAYCWPGLISRRCGRSGRLQHTTVVCEHERILPIVSAEVSSIKPLLASWWILIAGGYSSSFVVSSSSLSSSACCGQRATRRFVSSV